MSSKAKVLCSLCTNTMFSITYFIKKASSDNLIGIKTRKQDRKTDRYIPLCAEKQAKQPFRRPFQWQKAQKKLPEQRLGVAVPTA